MLGIGPLALLKHLEEETGKKVQEIFNCYAGTSTGAIIAGLLATGYSAKEAFDLFNENVEDIFTKHSLIKRLNPKCPKYDNSKLRELLGEKFGHKKFNELDVPLFITASRMNGESVEKIWDNDDEEEIAFGILTSTAAPTYFDVIEKNGTYYCDGGMWANDPSMVLQAGMKRMHPEDSLKMLVLNTEMKIPTKKFGNLSKLGWLDYFISDWIARSGNDRYFEARINLGKENIFRASPKNKSGNFEIDDAKQKQKVIDIWEKYYAENCTRLISFIKNSIPSES
ncbi:MAG: patatin-like phospholipase family protein [Fibrobacter sp.]|nr:patatin-like phospholipase family protein [Fibrobacter sp.]